MSLEYALERFPLKVKIRDGTECVIRPLEKRDGAKLQKFFLAVPEPERLFVKKPVTDRSLFRDWCRNADFHQNLPLLMLDGPRVAGEATLHQRSGGWKRHIGIVTVLTHPEYRNKDVAKILVDETIYVARHLGLRRLEVELNGERKVAIRAMEQLGFRELCRLPDYVMDMQSRLHDYVVMGMNLKVDEEFAGVG
ncbi:MAG TPA: GNAT family N-acetyltransferase [Clostridia bacterium]|nr:GNAT family N-acetyltransferase [Clostridia bacterium]